jgi:hypothetical protein
MTQRRFSEAELEREVRERIATTPDPAERRELRQLLIIRQWPATVVARTLAKNVHDQLLNKWATAEPDDPSALTDMSSVPDRRSFGSLFTPAAWAQRRPTRPSRNW